jgi:hypothetical protein
MTPKALSRQFEEIKDSKGNTIKDIVAVTTYLDGIVVATKNGLFTNVKSLLTKENK